MAQTLSQSCPGRSRNRPLKTAAQGLNMRLLSHLPSTAAGFTGKCWIPELTPAGPVRTSSNYRCDDGERHGCQEIAQALRVADGSNCQISG